MACKQEIIERNCLPHLLFFSYLLFVSFANIEYLFTTHIRNNMLLRSIHQPAKQVV